MRKTDRQKLLEMKHGKSIRDLMEEKLEEHLGREHAVNRAALDMDISISTFHQWARRLGMDLKTYERTGREDEEERLVANPAP